MSVKAIVFDLDDTLYSEYEYVKSGYQAVGKKIEEKYVKSNVADELISLFEQDRLNVFDRYMQSNDLPTTSQSIDALVETYRTHTPSLTLADEVKQTLVELRNKGYKLGIITDGRPQQQRSKIDALGIKSLVDKIIITDELGGIQFRKPNPTAFVQMANYFGIKLEEMVYVGDNPQKDFAVKKELPIKTIQLLNTKGVYRECAYKDDILPDRIIERIEDISRITDNL